MVQMSIEDISIGKWSTLLSLFAGVDSILRKRILNVA